MKTDCLVSDNYVLIFGRRDNFYRLTADKAVVLCGYEKEGFKMTELVKDSRNA